jgi:hypothetical protein
MIACACNPYSTLNGTGLGVMNFRGVWPTAFLAVGLIATIAWIGLLGYELFKLGGLAF